MGKLIEDRLFTLQVGNESGLGIFNRLPAEYRSAGTFADALYRAARTSYGKVGEQFLGRLVQDRADDEAALVASLRKSIDIFCDKAGVDPKDGVGLKGAETFGLVFAAAMLAKRYRLLPKTWKAGRAILASFERYRQDRLPVESFAKQLAAIADGPDVVMLRTVPAPDAETLEQAQVFISERKATRELLIRPKYRNRYLLAWRGKEPPAGLVEFIVKESKHWTVYRRLGKGVRERVHAFRLPLERAE